MTSYPDALCALVARAYTLAFGRTPASVVATPAGLVVRAAPFDHAFACVDDALKVCAFHAARALPATLDPARADELAECLLTCRAALEQRGVIAPRCAEEAA